MFYTVDDIINAVKEGYTVRARKTIPDHRNKKIKLVSIGKPLHIAGRTDEDARHYLNRLLMSYQITNPTAGDRLPVTLEDKKKPKKVGFESRIIEVNYADVTSLEDMRKEFYQTQLGRNVETLVDEAPLTEIEYDSIAELVTLTTKIREHIRRTKPGDRSMSNNSLVPSAVLVALSHHSEDRWYKEMMQTIDQQTSAPKTIVKKVDAEVNGCAPANAIKVAREYRRLLNEEGIEPLEAMVRISGQTVIKNGQLTRDGMYDPGATRALFESVSYSLTSKKDGKYEHSSFPSLLMDTIEHYHSNIRAKHPKSSSEKIVCLNDAIDKVMTNKPHKKGITKEDINKFMVNHYFRGQEQRDMIYQSLSTKGQAGMVLRYKATVIDIKDPEEKARYIATELPNQLKPAFRRNFLQSYSKK